MPSELLTEQNHDTPAQNGQAHEDSRRTIPAPLGDRIAEDATKETIQAPSILGDWTLDADATMLANSMFSDEIKDAIRNGLEQNPFDLSITNGMYISKGKIETITDKYEVVSVEGERVTIRLISGRVMGSAGEGTKTLSVRNGKLMIPGPGGLTCVMKRPTKNQGNTAETPTDRKEPSLNN